MKEATTIDKQIEILIKRGMAMDEGNEKAKEYLSDIGYFRLGFYCFPFEKTYPATDNRTHEYKEGSKISDVVKLYYLDVDLRYILIKYINRIEVNFRTNLIYLASNTFIESNTWFADNLFIDKDFVDKVLKIYKDIVKNKVLREHHERYKNDIYAPAWKTLEFLTFGIIVKLYKNIKDTSVKQKIAGVYDITNVKTFENYISAIVEIRNACAHGSVLFDLKLDKSLKNSPVVIKGNNRQNLYSAIRVIGFILGQISQNRKEDMRKDITAKFDEYKSNEIIKELIKNSIGYTYP
ncbi:Abortive infection bacteriophage resistance protein [Bacteroidales bacterium Barb6]|nr:Abortive infection bacteriophage resistance protein [Bacteroidales bacterium Barb6]